MVKLLEELKTDDYNNERPLLTSYIINKETGVLGEGFYTLLNQWQYKSFLEHHSDRTFERREKEACGDY